MRRRAAILPGLALCATCVAQGVAADDLRDPYFGEALWQAHQGRFFEALERLDAEIAQHRRVDEPELDSLNFHIRSAEFDVGDFELNYRMHHRAGRAIQAVLEADVEDVVRNEAAFRLARIHFQKDQPESALQALDRIHGQVPEAIRDDIEFLRANAYLALSRPADAVPVLRRLQASPTLQAYSAYNLGIALLQEGEQAPALQQLEKAGKTDGKGAPSAAIRDKSNMVLGRLLFESGQFAGAQRSFDRVQLEGPYSSQALLSAGWADASSGNFQRALVPWSMLVSRDVTDSAVQEAKLALPYAYGQLQIHGRAAALYAEALQSFDGELKKVDDSIRSIREGRFLQALVREEVRQDKEWVVRLRKLQDAPETYYLTTLMASHDFQTALQNYLDLDDLQRKLQAWQTSFNAFDDVIGLRRANYEPLLPEVDAQFRELDSQMRLRLEQRDHLRDSLQHILVAPRPELLATTDERIAINRLKAIEVALQSVPEAQRTPLEEQLHRLQGRFVWTLRTEYPERLTQAHKNARELQSSIDALKAQYEIFVRTRQAATHSYVGYDQPIVRLREHVAQARQRVEQLQAQQGSLIEQVAVSELKARADRLEVYQTQARYAVADSYDRATQLRAQEASP